MYNFHGVWLVSSVTMETWLKICPPPRSGRVNMKSFRDSYLPTAVHSKILGSDFYLLNVSQIEQNLGQLSRPSNGL